MNCQFLSLQEIRIARRLLKKYHNKEFIQLDFLLCVSKKNMTIAFKEFEFFEFSGLIKKVFRSNDNDYYKVSYNFKNVYQENINRIYIFSIPLIISIMALIISIISMFIK